MLNIGKAAVLDAGTMGAAIAAYLERFLALTVWESNKAFWKAAMKFGICF